MKCNQRSFDTQVALQKLIAEASALKDAGNAQALDALIEDIKGRLLSGETTGDEVLDYAILHKGSVNAGDFSAVSALLGFVATTWLQ